MSAQFSITVDPTKIDLSELTDSIEEAAFEQATGLALAEGQPVGSDAFIRLYQDMLEKYNGAAEYSSYFLHVAMLVVKMQLESEFVQLKVVGEADDDSEKLVRRSIEWLAKIIASSLIHTVASKDTLWVSNDNFERVAVPSRCIDIEFMDVTPAEGE